MHKWTKGYQREEPMPIKLELRAVSALLSKSLFPEDEGIESKQRLLDKYMASYCTTVAPGACTDFSPFKYYSKPVHGKGGGEVACEAPDETVVSCSGERCPHSRAHAQLSPIRAVR